MRGLSLDVCHIWLRLQSSSLAVHVHGGREAALEKEKADMKWRKSNAERRPIETQGMRETECDFL